MDFGASARKLALGAFAVSSLLAGGTTVSQAQDTTQKPNIVMLMTDDTG